MIDESGPEQGPLFFACCAFIQYTRSINAHNQSIYLSIRRAERFKSEPAFSLRLVSISNQPSGRIALPVRATSELVKAEILA